MLDARFSVPNRGVTALFGPSGSGKTSLLRAIAGLERGPVEYLEIGNEVWQDDNRFLPPHKRPIGYVFQESSLFPHLSVEGNLRFPLKRARNHRQVSLSLDRATGLLGLDSLLNRATTDLSGGERRRVAIARALLAQPRLLLMDEPLTGLDLKSREEILPYLDRLHEELEIPVFYVSHLPDEVARLADHILVIDGGRIQAAGPVAELLTRIDLPMAHGPDAEAILDARIEHHDEQFALTHLSSAAGSFAVPSLDLDRGHSVRLRVLARDVSLTLEHQQGTSILNIIPVTVDQVVEETPSQVVIRLDASGVALLARITKKSAQHLGVESGKELFAQVKSVAVLA